MQAKASKCSYKFHTRCRLPPPQTHSDARKNALCIINAKKQRKRVNWKFYVSSNSNAHTRESEKKKNSSQTHKSQRSNKSDELDKQQVEAEEQSEKKIADTNKTFRSNRRKWKTERAEQLLKKSYGEKMEICLGRNDESVVLLWITINVWIEMMPMPFLHPVRINVCTKLTNQNRGKMIPLDLPIIFPNSPFHFFSFFASSGIKLAIRIQCSFDYLNVFNIFPVYKTVFATFFCFDGDS